MKKQLSSVFYMWMGFAFAIIAVLSMFLPFITVDTDTVAIKSFFFNDNAGLVKGAWPCFMGYMFILVGGLAMGVMGLSIIQPSAKVEKIVLISAGALILVGTILALLFKPIYLGLNPESDVGDPLVGFYFTLVFGAAAVGMDATAIVLDW